LILRALEEHVHTVPQPLKSVLKISSKPLKSVPNPDTTIFKSSSRGLQAILRALKIYMAGT